MSGPAPRRLPLRIPPEEGESFASYIDRLAHDIRTPARVLAEAAGIAQHKGHDTEFPPGFGIFLTPDRLERFCRSTGLPRETVAGMQMTRYDGVCCDFSALDPERPRTLVHVQARLWTYFYATNGCPACLAESGGVWKLSWKLPWVFACAEHRALLVGSCPGCGKRLRAGRRRNPGIPDATRRVPEPTRCSTLLPSATHAGRRGSAPCDHPLDEAGLFPEHASLDLYPRLIEAQGRVDAALSGETPGEATREWFDDLGVLCVLLLIHGSDRLDAQDELCWPAPVRAAVAAHRELRRKAPERREELGRGPWDLRRTGPPENPALLAAVVTEATRVLACGSAEEAADALGDLAERVRDGVGRRTAPLRYAGTQARLSSASPGLRAAFERAWTNRGGLPPRSVAKGCGLSPAPLRVGGFSPEHVPQLFWEGEFEASFAGLLPGVGERYARRFCSMAFVRLMGSYSWADAAELLGIPEVKGDTASSRCTTVLKEDGNTDAFFERVEELVRRMAEEEPMSPRPDYGALRRALADFEAVPWEEWKAMCERAGAGRTSGRRGARDRAAAAHIWYSLAGGDPFLSPAVWRRDTNPMRSSYRKLAASISPELERLLLDYGRSLLPEGLRPPNSCGANPKNRETGR